MRAFKFCSPALLGVLSLISECGGSDSSTPVPPQPATLASITVTPGNSTLAAGLTRQFIATGIYSDGATKDLSGTVAWSSSNTPVASITNTGLSSALVIGSTSISAGLAGVSGSTPLTVMAAMLVSIDVTPATASVKLGQTRQFTATGTYTDHSTQNVTPSVTWFSAATPFVLISNTSGSQGLASGVAQSGSGVRISAALGSVSNSAVLTVTAPGWIIAGGIQIPRESHTATLLPNGKVLLAGGFAGGPVDQSWTAELYDPAIGQSTSISNMGARHVGHTATLLPNGKVLVAGGADSIEFYPGFDPVALYDPSTDRWTSTGQMIIERRGHTATLLQTGKVLVTSGSYPNDRTATAELYDPATGLWTLTGSLSTIRYAHTATLLPNGKVLVAGGEDENSELVGGAELYNPATGLWSLTGSPTIGRSRGTATLLPDGRVLVLGGIDPAFNVSASAELYNPATGSWSATGSLSTGRLYHTATLLPNGRVLVVGGEDANISGLASAELYDPATGLWSGADSLIEGRLGHTATLMPNGTVMVIGGFGSVFNLHSAELY